MLELIQCWSHAFKKNPNYRIVEDYFNAMKLDAGAFAFQPLKEAEAMFDVEEAPAWKEDHESTTCFRCRVEFTALRRRHHCRACGQIFCHACSSKTAAIPKYGIEKEVRVCDLCYDKLNRTASGGGGDDQLPAEYLNSPLYKEAAASSSGALSSILSGTPVNNKSTGASYKTPTSTSASATTAATTTAGSKPAEKTEQEFEEELSLALALSQSEAEAQEKQRAAAKQRSKNQAINKQTTSNNTYTNGHSSSSSSHMKVNDKAMSQMMMGGGASSRHASMADDAINASAPYAEPVAALPQKAPTATTLATTTTAVGGETMIMAAANGDSGLNDEEIRVNVEIDAFMDELKRLLELFVNRMRSDSQRGRSITNDTAVQSLFLQLQHLQPKLLSYIKYQEDARGYYENLQDKLTQLKDAREALNALRTENYEKKKRESEERERLRQLQIAHKLQLMRQQKQSYYLYQNQLNLQRLHEQELDYQARLNQQRELVLKRDQTLFQPTPQQSMQQVNDASAMYAMHPGNGINYPPQPMPMTMPVDPNVYLQQQQQQHQQPQPQQMLYAPQQQHQQQQQQQPSAGITVMNYQQWHQQQQQQQLPPHVQLQQQQQQQHQQPQQQKLQPMYYQPDPSAQQQPQQQQLQPPPIIQQQQQPQQQQYVKETNVAEAQLISFD